MSKRKMFVLTARTNARTPASSSRAVEEGSEFANFEDLTRKVVAVPKKEVDAKRGKRRRKTQD